MCGSFCNVAKNISSNPYDLPVINLVNDAITGRRQGQMYFGKRNLVNLERKNLNWLGFKDCTKLYGKDSAWFMYS